MPTNDYSLETLCFDNRFVRELPGDPEVSNLRRQVYQACYSQVKPKPMSAPRLLAYSPEMAQTLGLSAEACQSEEFCQVFVGNRLLAGMQPFAMNYGGHQFGHWAGQLGDGRAINLGEVIDPQGQRWTLQLKGAGPTPYSRNADGLAVLRSSIREFLCSEAMHHLGIPTTRALSVILTGEQVLRDMFYDGNPQWEPGAVVCRVAPSFMRFGNYQLFAARNDLQTLQTLVDYTLRNDFPQYGPPSVEAYTQWFAEVCRRTAELILHWQRVGFVHGVMNTDNLSILGLTIDYGPYGWLENYDPNWTPNTTDAEGRRYRFGNQPAIGYWNLVQLANALYPLVQQVEPLHDALAIYNQTFADGWQNMMAAKLGLHTFVPAEDDDLVTQLLHLLQSAQVDMTLFYRELADIELNDAEQDKQQFLTMLTRNSYQVLDEPLIAQASAWLQQYRWRCAHDVLPVEQRRIKMQAVNPLYVLRNYLAQQAIDRAEQGDFSEVHELLAVLRQPYAEQAGKQRFAQKRPDWAKQRAGCSMLSCSS